MAMLGLAAQGDRAFDHGELLIAGTRAIHDVAYHADARELFERRRFAPDDFERRDADALEVGNRAQPARTVRQTFRRCPAAVAVHVPNPIAIIGKVATQPIFTTCGEARPIP